MPFDPDAYLAQPAAFDPDAYLSGKTVASKSYALSEVPGAAVGNLVKSGAGFFGGIASAIRHPINTASGLIDAAAGGLCRRPSRSVG